ncbi:sterol desaturase family protein [Parasphingorhabdus cellanae]|uniref:Sterol desaturase family protein n=1 Tax=Parasphingorhabdus cellanae TaxID=2806553 RepID=A0ABX7SZ60_9SPHN|nr:sterol desaturase family protein [Parasphingorhabdus cellanae]QTD54561.1 sterol desaturase family protein [Parasphingorhabdus cellanae]
MIEKAIETLGSETGIWWMAGAYFGMVLAERVYHLLKGSRYDNADALCSIGLNLLGSVIKLLFGLVLPFALYILVYENFRFFTIDNLALAALLAFVVHELSYYWDHRLGHRVGLLWAFHSIHHSSNEFNHSTSARGFVLDNVARGPLDAIAALMGVPPIIFLGVSALKNIFGIWNHASYVGDLGPAEHVLATPRNHMVHHANQPHYIDKNYSQVLILWDKLFGSFEPYQERPVVGLVRQVHDNNPLTAQFAGIKQLAERMSHAERWQYKLLYLWKPPEWSHDGVCRSDCPKYALTLEPAE